MANVSAFTGAMPVIPGGQVESARVTRTTSYSVNQTTVSAASNIFSSDLTIVSDGTQPYLIEFYAPLFQQLSGGNGNVYLTNGGSTIVTRLCQVYGAASNTYVPVLGSFFVTPAAGTTTYNARAIYGTATATIQAGTGSGDVWQPMYLRAIRLVNQNDGLKPFWTPPVVTQLPSQATVGDQVVYAANATDGVYWSLYYDGIGTYPWKFIGGAVLSNTTAGGNNSRGSYGTITTGPSVTVPLAGNYEVEFSADCANNSSGNSASGFIALSIGGTEDTTTLRAGYLCGSSLNFGQVVTRKNPSKTFAASDVLTLESYSSGAINTNILYPSISIRPIRVSA